MPKREIVHEAGRPVASELRETLEKHFNEAELRKLERLGGRVVFSITAPYTKRARGRKPIEIDEAFVQRLNGVKHSTEAIQSILRELSVKELRALCKLVGQPIRSSDTAHYIRSELVRHLQAEDVWRRISGTA